VDAKEVSDMAEFSANALQTVNPGESIVFTENPVPCTKGLVRHRDGTGAFLLSGRSNNCCPCRSVNYLVDFGANIAVPTGETVGPISVAITIDGATIPGSEMTVTPAAVEEFFNVSRAINAKIWNGCCESVSIRNTSEIPILVQNANVIFTR
jgi:hypothetical protein